LQSGSIALLPWHFRARYGGPSKALIWPGFGLRAFYRASMAPGFLQLPSRREKDGTLVPKNQLSDNNDEGGEDAAAEGVQPESFITQAYPVQSHKAKHGD
jgi:hypothetical protein